MEKAKHIAFLPIVHGGLGLRSMSLIAPAAYWAAWADILPIIAESRPALAQQVLAELENPQAQVHCVAQGRQASEAIPVEHFRFKPDWRRIVAGERPPEPPEELRGEPGIWPHGWQFYASSAIITQHKERVVLPALDDATKARFRCQGGAEAGAFFRGAPVCEYTEVKDDRLNVILRRRARLPLAGGIRRYPGFRNCGCMLDVFGEHLASCPNTGRLRRRGTAFERVYRPLRKESAVRESEQPFVTELIRDADPSDQPQSDVLLRGLSLGRGLPVMGDMCMGTALHANGTPHPGAANIDGSTIRRLTYRKCVTEYPDLATSAELEYPVLACEEGGRWGPDQFRLVRDMVRLKVAPIHPLLRRSAALAYTRYWWSILSIGAQTVAADCILGRDSPIPTPESALPVASVLALAEIAPEQSRMA